MGDLFAELIITRKPVPFFGTIKVLVMVLTGVMVFLGLLNPVLLSIATALAAVYAFVLPRFEIEYEYLISPKELEVNCIHGRNKRSNVTVMGFDKMELLAPMNSPRLHPYQKVEIVDLSANEKDNPPYVVVAMSKQGMRKILLQLDEPTVEMMKNHMPRKVFSD